MAAFALVITAILFSVTGELFLKSGMNEVGTFSLSNFLPTMARILSTWRIWVGFAFFGVGAVFWLAAISRVNLSWAYPMLSLGYLLVLLFSAIVLKEHVSAVRWFGAVVIVAGIILVFRS